MKAEVAERLGIRSISDLAHHPEVRLAFSNEFLDRGDGWRALQRAYALPQTNVRGLDHDLAYRGLASGAFEVTDLYSTDAEVKALGLRVLDDDRHHFPEYQALLLVREAASTPQILAALSRLEGRISVSDMVAMNEKAKVARVPEAQVASQFLREKGIDAAAPRQPGLARRLLGYLRDHLVLVGVSLAGSVLVGLPVGHLRRAPPPSRPSGAGRRGRPSNAALPGPSGADDSATRHRRSAGHRRTLPLWALARGAKHVRRAHRHSRRAPGSRRGARAVALRTPAAH